MPSSALQSPVLNAELSALVRRADEDRWLASRLAPASARLKLITVYALNHEIARAPEGARDPLLGMMRLTWWRDALADIQAGQPPRALPVLQAYAGSLGEAHLWAALIEARAADTERAPFASWDAAETYVRSTAGGVMRLACSALGMEPPPALLDDAALAWGFTGLARAAPFWAARGREILPGPTPEAIARARDAYRRAHAQKLAAEVFPALGYVALAPLYLRALERGRDGPALLVRQLALVRAALRGRL